MQPKIKPWDDWGLWDVDGIKVRYISRNWVQFFCKHRVVNGETAHVNVYHTLLDRLRGIDFDDKVKEELAKFKNKYLKKNQEILALREKERRLMG